MIRGAPLRGTWLAMLAISVAFAASGVASAHPWHETVAVNDIGAVGTPRVADPGTTPLTDVGNGAGDWSSLHPTEALGPTDDEAAASDRRGEPATADGPLPSHAENHGDFVSAAAHDHAGEGAGCEVSSVARSDVGKDDRGKGQPSDSTVGACKDEPPSSSDGVTTKAGAKDTDKDKGKGDEAKGNGKGGTAKDKGKGEDG